MNDCEIRNICNGCKDCPDNKQSLTDCFDDCAWPVVVLHRIEYQRYKEAADE